MSDQLPFLDDWRAREAHPVVSIDSGERYWRRAEPRRATRHTVMMGECVLLMVGEMCADVMSLVAYSAVVRIGTDATLTW